MFYIQCMLDLSIVSFAVLFDCNCWDVQSLCNVIRYFKLVLSMPLVKCNDVEGKCLFSFSSNNIIIIENNGIDNVWL